MIHEVVTAVHDEMYECIEQGMGNMYLEREYGMALVSVEVEIRRLRNGMLYDDVDVVITHDGHDGRSTRLEKAIGEALPCWFNVEREVLEQVA